MVVTSRSSGISKGALAGIILGAIAIAVTLSAIVTLLIMRVQMRNYRAIPKRHHCEYLIMLWIFSKFKADFIAFQIFIYGSVDILCTYSVNVPISEVFTA